MTPADLYDMGMESDSAGDAMRELCALLGTEYPPKPNDFREIGSLQASHLQQRQRMQADNCTTH
jgi:hypothetical protein